MVEAPEFVADVSTSAGQVPRPRAAHRADAAGGAAAQFGHLDDAAIRKIARGNAIELFGLDLAA